MPHSLVVNFMPKTPIYPEFLTGRHIHALFLTLVSSVDKELADRLHEQQNHKAFALSPIQFKIDRRSTTAPKLKTNSKQPIAKSQSLIWKYDRPIDAGTPCWWRISLLDDTLFGSLYKLWLNLNPERPWHLGSANLSIANILGTTQSTQPWANFATYRQLYERASDTQTQINFQFFTPTAFRKGSFDHLLPDRDSVFSSLLSRWNAHSNIDFTKDSIEHIFPSKFDLHTEILSNYQSSFIGCIGEIQYRILGKPSPELIKQLNTLADFALFSGIGRKTTMGMGMGKREKGNGEWVIGNG